MATNGGRDGAVLVTGGSGFIGQQLVRRLAEQGRTVVALYHHKLPDARDNVYPVCCDMSSAELLAGPLRGVETVVHLAWQGGLAGPAGPVSFGLGNMLAPNAILLRNLTLAMEKAGTKRLIFLSAIGARHDAEAAFLREKYLAEHLVLNSRIPEKAIIRSSIVWGGQVAGGDRFLKSLVRVMRYPIYPLPKKSGPVAPVHVNDLAETLANVCSYPIQGQAALLDVTGGEPYEVPELFRIVSSQVVRKTRLALGGALGRSLLTFVERDDKTAVHPKIQQFLAIGGEGEEHVRRSNPLSAVLPQNPVRFREHLAD